MAILSFASAKEMSRNTTTRNLRQSGETYYNLEETILEVVVKLYAQSLTDVTDTHAATKLMSRVFRKWIMRGPRWMLTAA